MHLNLLISYFSQFSSYQCLLVTKNCTYPVLNFLKLDLLLLTVEMGFSVAFSPDFGLGVSFSFKLDAIDLDPDCLFPYLTNY